MDEMRVQRKPINDAKDVYKNLTHDLVTSLSMNRKGYKGRNETEYVPVED